MHAKTLSLVAAILLAAPFSLATAQTPPAGVPKLHCETDPADRKVHAYAAAPSLFVASVDGSVDDCDGDGIPGDGDGHPEFGYAGAHLAAGENAMVRCHGSHADHPQYPLVTVVDDVLGSDVTFEVWAYVGGPEPLDDCGWYDADYAMECVGSCRVFFPSGPDGFYHVRVLGTSGLIWTG